MYSPDGEVKDIAVISRVGKLVCSIVTDMVSDVGGGEYALLSRKNAMKICADRYISRLAVGGGIGALLPIDAISVSRISHPADRFPRFPRRRLLFPSFPPINKKV